MIRQERAGQDGRILVVILDRPERANCYSTSMLHQLEDVLRESSADSSLRAAVIAGAGDRSFCAGADLGELRERTHLDGLQLESRRVFDAWAVAPWPTVAAVNGGAIGGGVELALACDLRICAPHAHFALPETGLAIIPAAGGTLRLPQIVGRARSKEMILFGRTLDADTALDWGLVSEVTQHPVSRAVELAEIAARRDVLATRLAKAAIDLTSLPTALQYESVAQALLYERKRQRPMDDASD